MGCNNKILRFVEADCLSRWGFKSSNSKKQPSKTESLPKIINQILLVKLEIVLSCISLITFNFPIFPFLLNMTFSTNLLHA